MKGFTLHVTLQMQETQRIRDSMNIPKLNVLLIFTFYYKYLKFKNNYNLGNKTVLHLICNCIDSFVEV